MKLCPILTFICTLTFPFMATPIPIAKRNSSGTGGLIALILLLALLGGEHYLPPPAMPSCTPRPKW